MDGRVFQHLNPYHILLLVFRLPDALLLQLLADIFPIGLHRVTVGYFPYKIVGPFRQNGLRYFVYRNHKYHRLSGQRGLIIGFREGQVQTLFHANLCTDQLFLKSRDKAAGTDHQLIIFRGTARKGFPVQQSLKIQNNGIAVLHRTIGNLPYLGMLTLYADRACSTVSSVTGLSTGADISIPA